MMVAKQIDTLIDVAFRVLEEQVFMFGEPTEKDDVICEDSQFVMTSVAFDGIVKGHCFWVGPEAFGIELAANMLGVDVQDPLAAGGGQDAMKELNNVVCCQFLTSAYGSEPIFYLDSPQVQSLSQDGWVEYINSRDTVAVLLEDHPVLLGLVLMDH